MIKKTVIDLFCGCGGLSYGFINAGYDVLAGIDNEPKALETYKKNHKDSSVICGDISKTGKKEIQAITEKRKIDVLIGGPPCQGVSISGHRLKEDSRNELFSLYLRILSELKPKAFVMENIPGLIGLFNGELKDILLEKFEEYGYTVSYKILRADHYGVPQTRKRVFFCLAEKRQKV
jgi:DNA (cytosine-5)-methyltransferase 1